MNGVKTMVKLEVYSDVISGSKVNREGLNELYQRIYNGDLCGILLMNGID